MKKKPEKPTKPRTDKQKATQFGGANANPIGATVGMNGMVVRGHYRRLVALGITAEDLLPEDGTNGAYALACKLAGRGQTPNAGQVAAAHRMYKAMKGNDSCLDKIEDAIDGKLAETIGINMTDVRSQPVPEARQAAALQEILRVARKFSPNLEDSK